MIRKDRAWIELSRSHLKQNVKALQALLPSECRLMPVVKANAYGHGAALIALALQSMGIREFGVATVTEAITLRHAGVRGDILILGYTHPDQFPMLNRYDLIQTVVDGAYAGLLHEFGHEVRVHVAVDTGMHRLGERWENLPAILQIWQYRNLRIEGVFSHLCTADGMEEPDKAFANRQMKAFHEVVAALHGNGANNFSIHLQGSYGVLNYLGYPYDYARVGIALYGMLSEMSDETLCKPECRPVLTLKARISSIKDIAPGESIGYGQAYLAAERKKIAVLTIGYADGVPRNISGKGYVLCRQAKAGIIGRICMDQMFVDITDCIGARAGDEVILIGRSGDQEITAGMMAKWSDTITNEIVSRLGERLEREVV